MLLQRSIVVVILLPLGIAAIAAGGLVFLAVITLILGLAAWEYVQLHKTGGLQPAGFFVVIGVVALVLARYLGGFAFDPWLLPLLVLLSMGIHLVAYERGRDQAATDFAATLTGIFYFGLLGSFFVLMRELPNGQWWILVTLPAVWLADSGAYFIGSRFGRHKLSPRLSPKKSWEGYFGGILFGVVGTPLLVLLYEQLGLPSEAGITFVRAAVMGIVMGIFPTLGDLGESMVKRQVGVKDSGTLLPGHGGAFDRIDSWLWAIVIGYFVITWFFV
jgi:phosphatidate cytidylyltransferase